MKKVPKPDRSVPLMDATGRVNQPWDEFFAYLNNRGVLDMSDVSGTPSNGQVLIYNATTRKLEPGAN